MNVNRKMIWRVLFGLVIVLGASALAAGAESAAPSKLEQALREVRDCGADVVNPKSTVLGEMASPEEMAEQQIRCRPDPMPVAGGPAEMTFDAETIKRAKKLDPTAMHKLPSRFGNRALPLGITGAYFTEFQKRAELLVTAVVPDSPAAGVLKVEDVIIGANGTLFTDKEDPRPEMGDALVNSQSPEMGGILTLQIVREGKPMNVRLDLGNKVTYSPTWPRNCEKTRQIRQAALKYVMENYPWDRRDFWTPTFLMASGDDAALELARRQICAGLQSEYPEGTGARTWSESYDLINLCEYYMLFGDSSVLPAIRYKAQRISWAQYRSGSWSHGGGGKGPGQVSGGYGEINCAGLGAFVGLCLARQCGIEPYDHVLPRSVRFFGRFCGTNFPYGLGTPGARGGRMDNGMNSMAAMGFHLLGEDEMADRWARTVCYMWMAREHGHAEAIFSAAWGPVGAALAPAPEFHAFMNHMRWTYELGRARDGSLTFMRGGRWELPNMTAAMGLFLYLPEHRLQILGGDSVFAHRPPEELKDAAWLYRQKRWKEMNAALDKYFAAHRSPKAPMSAEDMYAQKLRAAYERMQSHAAATLKIIERTIADGDAKTATLQLDLLDRMLGGATPASAALRKQVASAGKGGKRKKIERPAPLVDPKEIAKSMKFAKGGIDNGFACNPGYIRDVFKQGFEGMAPEQIARFFNAPNGTVIGGAVQALADMGPKAVMPLMKRLLADKNVGVRACALNVIAAMYESDDKEYHHGKIPPEQQAVIDLVEPYTKDPSKWVRNAATGVMLGMKVVNDGIKDTLRDMSRMEGSNIDNCVRYGIKDPKLRVELCMNLIERNNLNKLKEPGRYKPINWAVGAHLELCGPYVKVAIDTLNNPEVVTMYGFFSQSGGDMSMKLLFRYHDNPLVLEHLADILRFGVRRRGGINSYWVACTQGPHDIVIALGPKAIPIVDEFFKDEADLYKRIAAGQEDQPVWWKPDAIEHLEQWRKDMDVTEEIVRCLYGLKPEDQAVQSLCDIYVSDRPWGPWERETIREHFTKMGSKVVPLLEKFTATSSGLPMGKLDKQVADLRAKLKEAKGKNDKRTIEKQLTPLVSALQRYQELKELATLVKAMNAKTPTADDVRTLCGFYRKRPVGAAYPFTEADMDYVRKYDEPQLERVRNTLQQWGASALPALRTFLAEDAKAVADRLAELDKENAYWATQRGRVRGGPMFRIGIEREAIQRDHAELKDLADLIGYAGQDKLSAGQIASLCRMYTRRAWPVQNKLIAELLKKAGKAAAGPIAEHVKAEAKELFALQEAIDTGMEKPSSRGKRWDYEKAKTLKEQIVQGSKELEAIAAAAK